MKNQRCLALIVAGFVAALSGCQTPANQQSGRLQQSILSGNTAEALTLIQESNDIDTSDRSGLTPLQLAVIRGDVTVMHALIAKGANVNQTLRGLDTVLDIACSCGNLTIVKELLDAGAKPDPQALAQAAASNEQEDARVVKGLLNAGARPELQVLARASASNELEGPTEIVELILSRSNEFQLQPADLDNALYRAVARGNLPVVKLLLAHNANVNALVDNGAWEMSTPLHAAARYGQKDICEMLINAGAQINAKDGNGQTALALAIAIPQLTSAAVLVNAGATFETSTNTVDSCYYSGIYWKLLADKQTKDKKNSEARETYTRALSELTVAQTEYSQKAKTDSKKAAHKELWHGVLAGALEGTQEGLSQANNYYSYKNTAQILALRNSSTPAQYNANYNAMMSAYRSLPVNYAYPQAGNADGKLPEVVRLRKEAEVLESNAIVCKDMIAEIGQALRNAPANANNPSPSPVH